MLFGTPPFNGENSSILYNLIRLAEVRFPKKIQVSNEVEDLILNVNSKNIIKKIISYNFICFQSSIKICKIFYF